ncbi:hypothetical protein CHS0354_024567 [Potamilus streckersoni]|uniref:MRH domain-containing protein n=1 Tax=Potamilus streckersoni TaxID=2493646 RepID=A0AAE0VN58_9BIVA|nr:hypothetical protein CHS0354_024567 [Potamilus streckersoni]
MIKSVCFLFVLFSSVNAWKGAVECVKTSTCSCRKDNGETIDLSALSTNNGTPKFQNVIDIHNKDNYSLSVCNIFSQGNCSNVAICQIRPMFPTDLYFDVGDLNTATFMEDERGQITINYIAGNRRSFVNLTCNYDIEAQLLAVGEQPAGSSMYHFELISKYACPITPLDPSSPSKNVIYIGVGAGVGALLLVVAILVYRKRIFSKCRKSDTYTSLT